MRFKVNADLTLAVEGLFDELTGEDAITAFEDVLEPLLCEFEEKLADRFNVELEYEVFPEATDIAKPQREREIDFRYDELEENHE